MVVEFAVEFFITLLLWLLAFKAAAVVSHHAYDWWFGVLDLGPYGASHGGPEIRAALMEDSLNRLRDSLGAINARWGSVENCAKVAFGDGGTQV